MAAVEVPAPMIYRAAATVAMFVTGTLVLCVFGAFAYAVAFGLADL